MITYTSTVEEDEEFKESGYTHPEFYKSLGLSAGDFKDSLNLNRKSLYGQFTDTERSFLYNFVRKLKPKKVVEFSPCHGYTTLLIRTALQHENINPDYFSTYELDAACYGHTVDNLKRFPDVNVVFGDVLTKMNMDQLENCDFLFVDSDHNKEFVQKYVDKFFNKLKPGTWVGIHDIMFFPKNGETEVVTEWLQRNKIEKSFYLADLMHIFGVEDLSYNVLGSMNKEKSSTMFFQI